MAKIKNVSGEDRVVPSLGDRLVIAGAVVEVSDDAVYGFTCQEPNWAPADAAAKKAHADATKPAEEPADNESQEG